MTMSAPLFIVSAGAVSNVGLNAASTCAAIRGSLSNFRETYFIDEMGQPIVGAAAPVRPRSAAEDDGALDSGGDRRLAAMFAEAASECLRGGAADVGETALVLICPETERPG
jgi:3-oxoacyl-[acyl-carrier-protein] synthase-1